MADRQVDTNRSHFPFTDLNDKLTEDEHKEEKTRKVLWQYKQAVFTACKRLEDGTKNTSVKQLMMKTFVKQSTVYNCWRATSLT